MKKQNQVSIEKLEPLIKELTKERPSVAKVKSLMKENGLVFSTDPIQQMSTVLFAMSEVAPLAGKSKKTELVEI